ncbi:MAG TPA: hypothetical protein DCE44_02740, partial [Verrucomicrobiales bacterium]|nr:hypothetical protein [Verrucomicrobiales bacterium]
MKLLRKFHRVVVTMLCLGGFVPTYWGALGADLARPVVGTRFSIVAPAFVDNLNNNRSTLETTQAQLMATLCAKQFPYLDWKALTNAASTNDPPRILKGSLVEEGQGAYPKLDVVFESPRSGLLLSEVLYPQLQGDPPVSTHDFVKLDSDLQDLIRRVLSTDDVRDNHL